MNALKWWIYLIVFCLPLYLLRFKIFGIPTTALELMIYGLFLFWLANKGYKNLSAVFKDERLLVLGIILLMVGISVATGFSWDLRVSAGIWKGWFADAVLFFVIFATTLKSKDIKKVFYGFVLSGFVVSVISLVYLLQGNLNFQGRLQGIYDSPNFLAMALSIPLIISLCFSLRFPFRTSSKKHLNMGCFLYPMFCLLFLLVLLFTKSYGAWLGIAVALVFGTVVYLYGQNKKKLALLLIIFIFAVIFIFGIIKIQSLEGLKSFDARFVIWQKAWQVFKTYPIIGIGPGTFQDYFPLYPKWGVPQPHNIFLAFLTQTGLLGFIGFIVLLIWFFRNGLKLFKTQYSLLLIMIMAYILIHGLVDTTYWKNDLAMIFWIIIGSVLVFKKELR